MIHARTIVAEPGPLAVGRSVEPLGWIERRRCRVEGAVLFQQLTDPIADTDGSRSHVVAAEHGVGAAAGAVVHVSVAHEVAVLVEHVGLVVEDGHHAEVDRPSLFTRAADVLGSGLIATSRRSRLG